MVFLYNFTAMKINGVSINVNLILLTFSKSWSCFIIFAIMLGCNKTSGPEKTKISIESTTQSNAQVKVSRYTGLDDMPIFNSKTDSAGTGTFEIILQRPMFVTIQIGEKWGELYLSPGDELVI